MKARTMMLTRTCSYCGLFIAYRSEKALRKADSDGVHMHAECLKASKEENNETD